MKWQLLSNMATCLQNTQIRLAIYRRHISHNLFIFYHQIISHRHNSYSNFFSDKKLAQNYITGFKTKRTIDRYIIIKVLLTVNEK